MESEDVSQPPDDAGLPNARPGDPPGASTVSDCGAAIVIPSRSAARPQVEQNRARPGRFVPQVGQTTAEFYLVFFCDRGLWLEAVSETCRSFRGASERGKDYSTSS